MTSFLFFGYHGYMSKYLLIVFSFVLAAAIPASALAQKSMDTMEATTMEATETNAVAQPPAQTRPLNTTQPANARTLVQERTNEARSTAQERVSAAREAFREKMATITDQQKLNRLTNLDTKLNEINQRRTAQLSERLERLTAILSRISSQEAALEEENTTTLMARITTAQNAIEDATDAVDAQAAKDYVVNITTETALRTNASTTVRQFATDIRSVHKEVVDAQDAVKAAYQALIDLTEEETAETPTTAEE